MMRKLLDYKVFLSGFLVFSILSAAIPTGALAQTTPTAGYSYTGTSGAAGTNSLSSLVVDTTGAIITAEISCHKDEIQSGIKRLFSGVANDAVKQALPAVSPDSPTTDQLVHLSSQDETFKAIQESATANAAATKKLTCTRAVEKAVAGAILRQLTISTVNWINHGMNGNPFYSTDTGSALRALRDQSIKDLNSTIGLDQKNYPFGKTIVQSLVGQMKASYEQSAQYSLNQVIGQQYPGKGGVDFNRDFSIGGWSAFLAQTFMNNNPIGFNFVTQQELTRRTADTAYSPAQDIRDQLTRSGGFFDQRICIAKDPKDPTGKKCLKYQVQTPGSVIAHALTKNLDTTNDQLINGQDLSVDLTAIFDALTNQLINKGLTSLSTNDSSSNYNFSNNTNGVPNVNGVTIDNNPNGSWANQNTSFNIFTDIPQIMRYEDNTQSLTNLLSGCPTDSGFNASGQFCNGNPKLPLGYQQILAKEIAVQSKAIESIYALDYCVPGPHPGWENEININAQNFVSNPNLFPASASDTDVQKILKTYGSTTGMAVGLVAGVVAGGLLAGTTIGSVVPGLGTAIGAIIGLAVGVVLQLIANDKNTRNESVYGPIMETLMGVDMEHGSNGGGREHVNGHDNSSHIITTLADRYRKAMHMVYAPTLTEVTDANMAAEKDPNGSFVPTTNSSTTYSTAASTATKIPDLSTTNKVRADIMNAGYNAFNYSMPDIVATDSTQFQNAQNYRDVVSQDQANLATSQSIERQLQLLLNRISLLPTLNGYPGVSGPLDLVPTIKLNGNSIVSVNQDAAYTDAGATATDGTGTGKSDLTANIIVNSNVDTTTPGIYTITYDVANKDGITANQVTRTVKVLDPSTDVLPTIQNYSVKNKEVLSAADSFLSLTNTNGDVTNTAVQVRDYNKDLQAIKSIRDISSLTDYENELKSINNIFGQIAPYIHGLDDLNTEQAVLDTMMSTSSQIAVYDPTQPNSQPTKGALAQCIKITKSPSYKGPTARVAFSYLASNDGTVKNLPSWLTATLPPSQSFLPDWHFAQGEGVELYGKNWYPTDGEPAYAPDIQDHDFLFRNYYGNTMKLMTGSMIQTIGPVTLDNNKLIRSDDISTITKQPVINAMKGLEHIVGMY